MSPLSIVVILIIVLFIVAKQWDKIKPIIKKAKQKSTEKIELSKDSIERTRQIRIMELNEEKQNYQKQIEIPLKKIKEIDNELYLLAREK